MHKIGQSGGLLGTFLRPLLKAKLPLILNVLKPLAKSALIPLGLRAAASATDAAFNKKMFRSSIITLIISNEEINDIMKIVKPLEELCVLIKGVDQIIKNEAKNKNEDFLECY